MQYNKKTDNERKDFVLRFRLTRDERKQILQLSKATGQTFSNIFRLRVLSPLSAMPELTEEIRTAINEQQAILSRKDIGDKKKGQLLQRAFVQRLAKKRIAHEMGQKRKKTG